MAYFSFVKAAYDGTPIKVFNHGEMARDFTYIDDIVSGIMKAADLPTSDALTRLYNLGNNRPEKLGDFVAEIERATGRSLKKKKRKKCRKAMCIRHLPISKPAAGDFGYEPTTPIAIGIPKFVEWYKSYYSV